MKILFALLFALPVLAEEYPIFDGQKYNGLYYPRIDVVEWGEPLHLEFHVYSKEKPVEITGEVIERGPNKVFKITYDLPHRKERLCRTVVAPPNFKVGQKLLFYQDKKDKDMNRIIVSQNPLKKEEYKAKKYEECEEMAAQLEEPKKREVASEKKPELPVWFDDKTGKKKNYWFD